MPPAAPPVGVLTATLAGNATTNQDHVLVTPHAVAVLDGATSWLPQDPARDGGWYARTLAAALTCHLDDAPRPLADVVAAAITDVRDRYALAPGDCPTSTLTIARWTRDTVEIYTLGDSPAVLYPQPGQSLGQVAGPVVVYDARLEPVGAAERAAYRAHLTAGHGYDARLASMVADLQRAERTFRNRPDGYWIAEADPTAADHAVTATFPRESVGSVLLATDGASADVLDYRRHTWDQVHHLITTASPAEYLSGIHAAEDADYRGIRWPRAKRHDDKTLTLITLTATDRVTGPVAN